MAPASWPGAEALCLLFETESKALLCVYVCVSMRYSHVCVSSSAYKSNAVQAGRRCVCPRLNREQVQVRVSAFIPLQASPPVFLSHSLFLSFSQ